MRCLCPAVVGAVVMVAGQGISARPLAAPAPGLDVCIVASSQLALSTGERATAAAEANAIWNPFNVSVRWTAGDDGCDRMVLVKVDTEAFAAESADEIALAWVPFVEGRARRVVFLRLDRTRRLIAGVSPGSRPEAMDSFLFARFIGRSLAHELGHVILNSRNHSDVGLMRSRYRPRDVLNSPTRSYTLSSAERAVLFAAIAGEVRLAAR